MLQKLIKRFLYYRHPWRALSFDELGELYSSMMLRSLAISLVGIFVPVYLYKFGYSITAILLFYGTFFTARIVWDFAGGYLVARYGPKHSIVVAYILQIVALAMFATLQTIAWPLIVMSVVWSASNSIFFIAYHTDFSKIKHSEHGGRELGWMHIVEKIGGMLGPITGGVIATLIGPSYTFLAAVLLFCFGLIPLFLTGEAVKTRQKLDFKGLSVTKIKHDLVSYVALSIENSICLAMWPLFMALFIFQDNTFVQLGAVSSIAVILSIVAAKVIASFIDNHRGRQLLKSAAVINAFIHGFRPFLLSLPGAIGINIVNETVTVAYRMPYVKGMYDAADDLPGHRIVYFVATEVFGNIGKASFYWLMYIASFLLEPYTLFCIIFACAAVASLTITTERFKALA